jgi:capsid protein
MGLLSKILKLAWPTMSASYGGHSFYRDHYSDGSKYRKGIHGSGYARVFDNNVRKINARNAYEESKIGRAIIRRKVDTAVESGIKFRSKPIYDLLPVSKEMADKFARELTLRFHLFNMSKHFSSNGTMNGYQFQRHIALQQCRDGEYFVVFNRGYVNKNKQLSRLSFQSIDPMQIKGTGGTTNLNGYNDLDVDKGIIRGKHCEEIGYVVNIKVKDENGRQLYKEVTVPAFGKNGITRIVHGFIPEYANQLRGNGDLFPFIQELQQYLDLDLAHLNKSIAQSNLVLASETDGDENSVNPFEGLGLGQDGIAQDVDLDVIINDDPLTTESNTGKNIVYKEMDEAQITTPGSVSIFNMPKGNKIKMLSNTAPTIGHSEFMDGSVGFLAPAVDMSIDFMKMKFGSNYNANRAVIQLAYKIADIFRKELISDFLDPALEAFAEVEIAEGRLSAPGFSDPMIRKAYLSGEWIGAPMPEIDPLKQGKANKIDLEIGATTLDRIAIERNGSDGFANRSDNAVQFEQLTIPYWQADQNDTSVDDSDTDGE